MPTTTTTTSTTTTTTTLAPGQPVPQETSRGDIATQNDSKTASDTQKNNITTGGIVNLFKTTIQPQEIQITTPPDNQAYADEVISGLGYVPVVWYNGIQIDTGGLQYVSVYYDGILPAMRLSFTDVIGVMKDKGFPLDDTKITLFLNSRSEQLKPVYIQFKIRSFTNNDGLMIIDSILDVDGLYFKKFKSYSGSTSNKTLQDVCKEIGLGFNTNITETNDKMNWLNLGKRPYDFILDVIDSAYISDDSFVAGNVDLYYNLNFVDIQKELSRNIDNEIGVSNTGMEGILKVAGEKDLSNLFLTNDAALEGQNNYFTSFRIVNNATEVAVEHGYTDILKYYNTNDKSLLKFNVDSMNNNSDKSIILKGAPQDESFYKSNVNYVYGGKIDSDNMHKNYNYSKIHNNRNIYESQKISLELQLPSPNYNIYRFQKIKIFLSSNSSTPASSMVNNRLSGDWIIVDIEFRYMDGAVSQRVSLVKRELELAVDELASELVTVNKGNSGTRGTHDNPGGYPDNGTPAITGGAASGSITNKGGYLLLRKETTNWTDICTIVIANLEGGYDPPDLYLKDPVKYSGYKTSGETMFGIDRKQDAAKGTAEFDAFWGAIDEDKRAAISQNRHAWYLNYIPPAGPFKSKLFQLCANMQLKLFNKFVNRYITDKSLLDLIKSDGRLLFHFAYAVWNGEAYFKGIYIITKKAYDGGTKDSGALARILIQERQNGLSTAFSYSTGGKHLASYAVQLNAQGGNKIAHFSDFSA